MAQLLDESIESYRFENAYRHGDPMWVIERTQPCFIEAERQGLIQGNVLDAGCGTGDLTLFLAERGYRVTGIDFAPSAIQKAIHKRDQKDLKADFMIEDVLNIGDFRNIDTVVDSATYHCLNPEERQIFVEQLGKMLESGGRYIAMVSANKVTAREIVERFEDWQLNFLGSTEFVNKDMKTQAYFFCFERN